MFRLVCLSCLAIMMPWVAVSADEEGLQVTVTEGLSDLWTARRYLPENLWAYQPVVRPPIPIDADGEHPADAFLTNQGRAPRADRRTLLRRVTYDLLGVPPSPEETALFLSDPRPDEQAFSRVVDRLLASPHYGERYARHWLDVTRYADSAGFANDYERGSAWRYRDYVVRAFNEDKPYNTFVREQLAGDEIRPDDPEAIVASGFLRMGPWELTGMEVAKVARQRFLDDVTNSVGETFLSQSLQCARCHDHKFDPVPTRDYYAFQAVFATTQLAERSAAFLDVENRASFSEETHIEKRRADFEAETDYLNTLQVDAARTWYRERNLDATIFEAALKRAKGDFIKARAQHLKAGVDETLMPGRHVGFEPEHFGRERVARKGLERLRWEMERYLPRALAVYNGSTPRIKSVNAPMPLPADPISDGDVEETCVLKGGDPFSPLGKVAPGALSVLAAFNPAMESAISDEIAGRRKALAEWIARPDNPLTTRSIANRLWGWHFGTPIAGNPNNFGATGKKPTHPELLNFLANSLTEHDWSLKHLHKSILSTTAYARAADPPPKSPLSLEELQAAFVVFKARRLTAEELRDSLLAVTGEWNREIGGLPNRPNIHPEVALQPRQVMGTFASAWQANPLPWQRNRRSLYARKLRGMSDPFMEVFNAPAPDFSCEAREASNVTPQVFALLNGHFSHQRALLMALRLLSEENSEAAVIDQLFQLTLNRAATPIEMEDCVAHWHTSAKRFAGLTFAHERPPLSVTREAVEENTGERFVFSEKLHENAEWLPDFAEERVDARARGLAEVCLVLFNANEFIYVY